MSTHPHHNFKRGGAGRGTPVRKPQATASSWKPVNKTACWIESEPPNPIVAVGWSANSPNSYRLGKLLREECRLGNNWGMFNFWQHRDPPEYTNEHPGTCVEDPQLNTDPMTAIRCAKAVLENSPLVSDVTLKSS